MKQTSLSRRLLAGAAGLAVATVGVLAFAAPAQATGDHTPPVAEFTDDCEGTTVKVTSGSYFKRYWTFWVDGEEAHSEWVEKQESYEYWVPGVEGQEIKVDYKFSPRGWPKTHTWYEPKGCELENPRVTVAVDCDTLTITLANPNQNDVTYTVVPSVGEPVDVTVGGGGGSEEIAFPAAEGLTVDVQYEGESVLEEPVEITPEIWAELDCDEGDEGEGEGGELPETGSRTLLIAGGALALLALGGGLYLVARRRRLTFTA